MYQQQRIITSNYQVVPEDEYTVLLVYALNSDIQIYLPYASNFDKVIILKADNTLNEVFVNLKGNDTFEGGKSPYRLTSQYQLVEFTTDNESNWYAVSVYSSGSAATGGGSGGVSVHSALAGLTANDHRQYLHVSGSNNLASNFNFAGFSIYNINMINDVDILSLTASIDGHILDTNNPHATTFSNLDPGTLAQLNSVVIDANLDDSGSARPPLPHSASHMSGGSDPININQLGARGVPEGHTFAVGPNGNVVTVLTSSLGVTNHGSLNGLGNLDHPQYETTASFRPFSESVKTFTSSVVTFSSSYSSRISSLEAQSASITSSLQILQNASSSFRADIQNLQVSSASFSSRITNLESASGTFVTQTNQLFAASASFDNTSASYARFSASFVGFSASWSAGTTDLTSLNSFSQSIQSFTASHASRHLSGGADPIDAQSLRGNGLASNRILITDGNGGWTTVPSSSIGGGGGGGNNADLNAFSASIQSFTSSIQTFSESIQSQTASIQVFSASTLAASGAFATISSSYKQFSASFVGYSASWSAGTTNIGPLNSFSQSIQSFTASIQSQTASIQTFSSSLLAASSSFESRHISQTASIVRLDNSSASYAAFSASFTEFSASWSAGTTDIAPLNSFSASIQSQTASIQVFSASTLAASGAFAIISSSYKQFSASYVGFSASWSSQTVNLLSFSQSVKAFSASIQSQTASIQTFSASILVASSSWTGVSQSYHGFSASHASRHLSGGADPIDAQNLRANAIPVNHLLISNANGGWTTVASSSVGGGGSTDISALNESTASIQIFSASMLAASGAFATISSSYKQFSASFVDYSASWSTPFNSGTISQTFKLPQDAVKIYTGSNISFANTATVAIQTFPPQWVDALSFSVPTQPGIHLVEWHILFRSAATTTGLGIFLTGSANTKYESLRYFPNSATAGTIIGAGSIGTVSVTAGTPAQNRDYLAVVQAYVSGAAQEHVRFGFYSEVQGSAVTLVSGSLVRSTTLNQENYDGGNITISSSYAIDTTPINNLNQFSQSHASRHLSGGLDPIDAQSLRADAVPANHLLISNANGGWTTIASSSVGGGGSTDISALNEFTASHKYEEISLNGFSFGNYLSASSTSFPGGTAPFSVMTIFSIYGRPLGSDFRIAGKSNYGFSQGWWISFRGDLRVETAVGTGVAVTDPLDSYQINNKIIVAGLTYDGTNVTPFIQGSLLTEMAAAATWADSTGFPVEIGSSNFNTGGQAFSASVFAFAYTTGSIITRDQIAKQYRSIFKEGKFANVDNYWQHVYAGPLSGSNSNWNQLSGSIVDIIQIGTVQQITSSTRIFY